MKKIVYIACLLALCGCQKGRTYFPKDIEPQHVEFVRFDNALLNVHEASVKEDVKVLYDEYPEFMPLWVEDILGIPSADTLYLEQQLPYYHQNHTLNNAPLMVLN